MDIENWKTEVTDLADEMPKFDAYVATAFGIAVGNVVAIISVYASVAGEPNAALMRLLWGLTIAAVVVTISLAFRTKGDRDRLKKRSQRLCAYMDKCQRKLEKAE